MEFNVLPKSKFLSLSPRNTHRSSQTTNQTVNVILPRESKQDGEEPSVSISTNPETLEQQEQNVHYATREVKLDEPVEKLTTEDSISTINFLKLVLQSYMSNPIKYNDFIICSIPVLEHLIEVLTGCDDCSIDVADIETTCCKNISKRIVPISKIWCKSGDSSEIFKYRYSQYLQIFEEYRISLKFIYLED